MLSGYECDFDSARKENISWESEMYKTVVAMPELSSKIDTCGDLIDNIAKGGDDSFFGLVEVIIC